MIKKYYTLVELMFLKVRASKIICQYWYFLEKRLQFQSSSVCSVYHDVLMSVDLSSIAILKIHGVDYCCMITRIVKLKS